ncbi:MAG TPA: Coenzyme F420 hydrogenase/dehydrogenase, beta subunit C-terminal domain [Syntrophales bacterium]|nr:Coenzyme F420 hydrogenase/dehydrogenase, beta subunit C-terminal domain [Syntrophales bacterium]
MNIFGPKELMEDVILAGRCTGCGACVDICPYFGSHMGKTAMLFPCTIARGRCFASCPRAEVDLDLLSEKTFGAPYAEVPVGSHRKIFVSRSGARIGNANYQAGGTVSALLSFVLEKGIIDAAVLVDRQEGLPRPRRITEPQEVLSCASSSFAAVPVISELNRAVRDGYRRIGTVATPCQAVAAALIRINPLDEDEFINPLSFIIGLFCTWALDLRSMTALFSGRGLDLRSVIRCDVPPPPAEKFEIVTGGGKHDIPLQEVRDLTSPACAWCPDMTSEFADVSVGMLEGSAGKNILIIRTPFGEEIAEKAREERYIVLDEIPPEQLRNLERAAAAKKRRALLKLKKEGLLNTAGKGKRACFRLRPEILEKLIG